jgi:hypothetical protein
MATPGQICSPGDKNASNNRISGIDCYVITRHDCVIFHKCAFQPVFATSLIAL